MASEQHRVSSKSIRAPLPPKTYPTLSLFQSNIPINPTLSNPISSPLIKDLRHINLLNEIYSFDNNRTHVQETVEVIPQPVSCERIFYSYIDDHTNLRSKESIQLNQNLSLHSNHTEQISKNDNLIKFVHHIDSDQRLKVDFYSTTLYIYPKQRNEKFISEIRYTPEHITIRYKTSLEFLAATVTSHEHYYENIQDFYQIVKDIFYRI